MTIGVSRTALWSVLFYLLSVCHTIIYKPSNWVKLNILVFHFVIKSVTVFKVVMFWENTVMIQTVIMACQM
jgi:hypothetical protein